MTWGEKADRLAKEKGLSYAWLERQSDMQPSTLKAAMIEGRNLGVDKAIRLATALSVPVTWLFDESQDWPPGTEGANETTIRVLVEFSPVRVVMESETERAIREAFANPVPAEAIR